MPKQTHTYSSVEGLQTWHVLDYQLIPCLVDNIDEKATITNLFN